MNYLGLLSNDDGAPVDLATDSVGRRVMIGLTKIGLALKSRAWQEAGRRKLTPTQAQILALLRVRAAQHGLRLRELAAGMGVMPATASEALRVLVDKGLVRKARSGADARSLSVTLTARGRREADRVAGWPDFLVDAIEALSAVEQAVFLRGLIKMIRSLQERGEVPISRMCVSCRFFRPNVHADQDRPHHCAFVDAAFGDRHLRLECSDHHTAPAESAARNWSVLTTHNVSRGVTA